MSDIETILAEMVEENRLSRDRATADVSRLLSVTVGGTDDEFERVTRDLLGLDGDGADRGGGLPEEAG
jgi:hypothetical protein